MDSCYTYEMDVHYRKPFIVCLKGLITPLRMRHFLRIVTHNSTFTLTASNMSPYFNRNNHNKLLKVLRNSFLLFCQIDIFFLIDVSWPKTALFKNMVLDWHISSTRSMQLNSMMACAYLLVNNKSNCIEPLSFGLDCTMVCNG